MKTYESTHLIKMEDLNHHQSLYAGRGMEWLAEAAFTAAALTYGNADGLVYRNTHQFGFMKPVEPGNIVTYYSTVVRVGKTSLTVRTALVNRMSGELHAEGYVTFVTVPSHGGQQEDHGLKLNKTTDREEQAWREIAEGFFNK